MDLDALIRCWQITSEFHSFKPGATEDEIVSVEQELGFRLPEAVRELYRFSDGLDLCEGNLSFYPLRIHSNDMSLCHASAWLRACHWPIPETVLVFGGNGSGEPYGLWTGPHAARFPEPVILVGEVFRTACMSVSASAILPFLACETASYLQMQGLGEIAHDILGVPRSILDLEPGDDEALEAIFVWADPQVLDVLGSPYENPLDAQGLQTLLS